MSKFTGCKLERFLITRNQENKTINTTNDNNFLIYDFDKLILTGILLLILITFGLTSESHAGATADCDIPNAVVCEYTDPEGIYKIVVTVDLGTEGKTNVVDENFHCATDAVISFDPVAGLGAYDVKVTSCQNGRPPAKLKLVPQNKDPFIAKKFKMISDQSGKKVQAKPIVVEQIGFKHAGDSKNVTVSCNTVAACDFVATVCDAVGGVGECFDDHCECNTQ